MNNYRLFEEDFDIVHELSIGYKYYEDELHIYGMRNKYDVIGLHDFNCENRWEWLSENVHDSLISVNPNLTKGEIHDVCSAIIQLSRRYPEYLSVPEVTESVCNQFQKLITAYRRLTDESTLLDYRNARKSFIKKFNWATYHFMINSIYAYDFGQDDEMVHFNEYMEQHVNKELICMKYYDKYYRF